MLGNIGYINRETSKELNIPLQTVDRVVTQYFKEFARMINHNPNSKIKLPKIGNFEMRMTKAKSLAHYYIKRLRHLRTLEERNTTLEKDYESKLRALWCQIEEHRKQIISRYVVWNNYLIKTYGDKAQIKYNYHLFTWKFLENE